LRVTKYNDGTAIPLATDKSAWGTLTTPSYCYYDYTSNADSINKFGALYNGYAVNTNKLAPMGWHVPTDAEWDTLQNYLIANGYNWDGSITGNMIAKSMAAKTDWFTSTSLPSLLSSTWAIGNDLTFNNRSGFSALPGGYRDLSGDFYSIGYYGYWWSATENDLSPSRYLYYGSGYLDGHGDAANRGFSVRLVRY